MDVHHKVLCRAGLALSQTGNFKTHVAMGVHFKQNVMCAHVQMQDPERDPVIGAHSMIAEDPPSSLAEFMSDKKSLI